MPATESIWRNLRLLHVVFAWSAFATLATTVWMLAADFDDEWRPIQNANYELKAARLEDQEREIKTASFNEQQEQLKARVQEADAQVAQHQDEISQLEKEIDKLESPLALAIREVRSERAERDKLRADLDLQIRDGVLGKRLSPFQDRFDAQQAHVDRLEARLQNLQNQYDALKAAIAEKTTVRDEAVAALKQHQAALGRLEQARQKIEPDNWFVSGKRRLMQLPIIEGFNGPLKVNQIWLPDLTINFGGMRDVPRFDRCTTCHQNIDAVETGNVPSFPHDDRGITLSKFKEFQEARREAKDRGETPPVVTSFAHPFSTHPRPDLYLTAASPHPMQKFGCTICHEGQGSGTSFQNASHSPDYPAGGDAWHEEYGWYHNHFWEFPMYPQRLAEASCVKCHHDVVELGVNPQFGATAPNLYAGYELVRKYGCFGCHEVNGFNAGKPIGPDMRLEPQTADEAERIAADATAVAGTMRKVGPGLRHFSSKTTPEWAEFWVHNPRQFRPETRMPQFFGLTNQKDPHAQRFQPVEIAAMVKYLFKKSEPLKLDHPAEGYEGNTERGKLLFSQRGCLACHAHDEFPGIKPDFGPNLTNVAAKIKPGEDGWAWVYTWVRDPERHSARTRMPNTFLEAEGEGEKRIDPAADITAYLLSKGPKKYEPMKWDDAALDDLVKLYLSKVLTPQGADDALAKRIYPQPASEIKGDEIELADGPISPEMKLLYVGRRSISRYGCYGCHDIPGFEKARPIGTGLQDWGRKDSSKLALEHIEEYLHLHGEPGGGSTQKRVAKLNRMAANEEFRSDAEREQATSAAYFYGELLGHGRAGFLWQKLRDPRSYDFKKTETKGYDERLRMPQFPLREREIEQIANFILGLVAEPPAEKYLYRPRGAAKARIDGEKLLQKYNCVGCHVIDLPEVTYRSRLDEFRLALSEGDSWNNEKWESAWYQTEDDPDHPGKQRVKRDPETNETILKWHATEEAPDNPGQQRIKRNPETKAALSKEPPPLQPFVRGVSPEKLLNTPLSEVEDLNTALANPAPASKYRAVDPEKFVRWFESLQKEAGESGLAELRTTFAAILSKLVTADRSPSDYVAAMEQLLALKPPEAGELPNRGDARQAMVRFHGLMSSKPDPEDAVEDQEFGYDLWATLKLGDKVLLPQARILVPAADLLSTKPARGGDFAEWLVDSLMKASPENNRALSWQMSPPPLYREGMKVQTPWLFNFLRNPDRLRFTTVLRMPRFNMSAEEAAQLANYFPAADGSPYPYQAIDEREPEYLGARQEEHPNYLPEAWKLLNAPLCIKCHSLGGREYQSSDPKKDIRGPNLDVVASRLRPDWTLLWLFKPPWITPFTSMPQPLPRNQQNFPELFHGDGLTQTVALRDALMNYYRLLEREGKLAAELTSPAPAENTPPAEKPEEKEGEGREGAAEGGK